MATPEMMWSTPKVTVATAWSRPPARAAGDPDGDAPPRPVLPRAPRPEPGPEDHHPLEADVHDAAALGVEAAEGGQQDRHGEARGSAPKVPNEVSSGLSVTWRTIERTRKSMPATISQRREPARPGARRPARRPGCRTRARDGRRASPPSPPPSPASLMPVLPPRQSAGPGSPMSGVFSADQAPLLGLDQPLDQLVGDHHREDDDALHDHHDLLGDVLEVEDLGAAVEEGEQQRADGDADRVVAPEQGDGDAGEARARWRSRARSCGRTRAACGMPTSPATAPGQEHALDDHRLRGDAAGLGGERVEPAGPQVVAEAGPPDEDVVEDADERRASRTMALIVGPPPSGLSVGKWKSAGTSPTGRSSPSGGSASSSARSRKWFASR